MFQKSILSLCVLVLILWLVPISVSADDIVTLVLDPPKLSNESAANTSSESKTVQSKPQKNEQQSQTVRVGRVGVVQVAKATIYTDKKTTSRKFTTVKSETPLAIVREESGWYGVIMATGDIGWIKSDAVKMTGYELVSKKVDIDRGAVASRGGQSTRPNTFGEKIVQDAMQYSGLINYVFGGNNPNTGMDCSAFVKMIFSQHGINLPRTARSQAQIGTTVPLDKLLPGDRLYFSCKNPYIDHCGIYTGNGYFVHCNSSKNGVTVDSLASPFYWQSLVTAKRS